MNKRASAKFLRQIEARMHEPTNPKQPQPMNTLRPHIKQCLCDRCEAWDAAEAAETNPTGTEARVCADIARRQQFGIKKYGTTVRDNPLTRRQWIEHAYYEALDLAVYLKRTMEETDAEEPRTAIDEIIQSNHPQP